MQNRAIWVVHRIHTDRVELRSLTDSTDTRTVTHDYVHDHVHLAYASTVHGIQGENTDAAIVGPGVDAADLYVGMTRGRTHNLAIAVARGPERAREGLADTISRGPFEVLMSDARDAARSELHRAASGSVRALSGGAASVAV